MGTLYVIGAPAGEPRDLTRRASAILQEAALVVADDEDAARRLLDENSLSIPVVAVQPDASLAALAEGDVALVYSGRAPAPSQAARRLIRSAIEKHPVVPIPGPSLPITALILSGLPADSFVYLGGLPPEADARRDLLSLFSAEHRSLLALASSSSLAAVLADLHNTLGDRSLALVASSPRGAELAWRGSVAAAAGGPDQALLPGEYVLVVGGAPDEALRWEEERLLSEIQDLRAAGLGVKELSQQLAERSGWSRREIYRLSLELARQDRSERGETHAS